MKRRVFILLFVVFLGSLVFADAPFSVSVAGSANFPVINRELFSTGGGGGVTGSFRLGELQNFRGLAQLGYFYLPVQTVQKGLSVLSAGAGAEMLLPLMPILDFRAAVSGGYGFFIYPGSDMNYGPYAGGDLQLVFNLSSSFHIGIGGGYSHYFNGIYSGLTAGLGTIISIGGGKSARIEFDSIQFEPVFPVLYKFYDRSPLGSLKLHNAENGAISNVSVTLFVKNYMDNPKECFKIARLSKGEDVEVPLYALFNDSVLDITEGAKVQAEITVEYEFLNDSHSKKAAYTMELYDRNALSWDDNSKAAAFITAKDPNVLTFAKNFGGIAREQGTNAIDQSFSMALGIFEALRLYGMNYVRDPGSAYDLLSVDSMAVDYLQFPYQTLQYKAGDCDDLSILYCTLLEAVGIETAFVTVPGHIYMAFSLKTLPDEVNKTFDNPGSVINRDGKAWIPVEITMIESGFLEAWETGLNEWNKNTATAGFYPVHTAWKTYVPVGFSSRSSEMDLPGTDEFLKEYSSEMNKFIAGQIQSRVAELRDGIAKSGDPAGLYNKLGVLYARFGLYDKAEEAFSSSAEGGSFSSMVNLGNIYFLKGSYGQARDTFLRSLTSRSDSVVSLLGLAKSEYELKNFKAAENAFNQMAVLKPQWAAEFAYLGASSETASRAADQTDKLIMYWEE